MECWYPNSEEALWSRFKTLSQIAVLEGEKEKEVSLPLVHFSSYILIAYRSRINSRKRSRKRIRTKKEKWRSTAGLIGRGLHGFEDRVMAWPSSFDTQCHITILPKSRLQKKIVSVMVYWPIFPIDAACTDEENIPMAPIWQLSTSSGREPSDIYFVGPHNSY